MGSTTTTICLCGEEYGSQEAADNCRKCERYLVEGTDAHREHQARRAANFYPASQADERRSS